MTSNLVVVRQNKSVQKKHILNVSFNGIFTLVHCIIYVLLILMSEYDCPGPVAFREKNL